MAVLSILIDRAGEIVTREELQDELWRGGTNVDFENGLNAAVNRLRQTLGESAGVPRYVETIAGRGYRFIAPIERQAAHPVLQIAPAGEQRFEKLPDSNRHWVIAAAVTLLVTAGAYAGYRFGVDRGTSALQAQLRPVRYTVVPPPGFEMNPPSSRQSFALSPDGSRLAFSAMGAGGGFELFLRDFDSLETKPVPDAEGAYHMFWATDSQSLIISAKGKLRRLSMVEGAAQQILGDQPAMMFSGTFLDVEHLALGGRLESRRLSIPGGGFDAVTETYRWPQLLPDGKHVLDINFDSRGRHVARVIRPGAPEPVRELMETDSRVEYTPSSTEPGIGYLVYVRAGNLMAQPFDPSTIRLLGTPTPVARKVYTFLPSGAAEFSVSQNGTLAYQSLTGRSQLMWLNRSGRPISEVSPPNLLLRGARVSPDQRTVASAVYDIEKGATSIWHFDAANGAGRIVSGTPGNEEGPVWSPDSRKFVFSRAHVTLPSIFMRFVSEEGREDAVSSGGFHGATDWSSDGRYIVFTNTGFSRASYEANGDLFLIDTRTRAPVKPMPLLSTSFHESAGSWSPDGKWLAFTSNESGRPEIYLQRFEGGDTPSLTGQRYPVTLNGAELVRWRRDGKELFYLSHDGFVYAIRVTLGDRPQFEPPVALFRFSAAARTAIHGIIGFDVSPDGQKFVVPVVHSEEQRPIVVIRNWQASLGRAN